MKTIPTQKSLYKILYGSATALFLLFHSTAGAQIPPNAVNADPSAKAISQVPLGSNINGTAVLRFRFSNEATSVNSTGQIPANTVRLTISFPGQFAFLSVNAIPKFVIEDEDPLPFGVVHLVNNALILEGEVVDLLLNVRGTAGGTGTVTFNADRIVPIAVGNTQTANDNASSSFTTTGVLPVKLVNFAAQKQGCTAKLAWTTANEVNFARFEVQVSTGGSFTAIGNVPASSISASQKEYAFTHEMKGGQTHLYRLKIIDKEGGFTYSPVARVIGGCSDIADRLLIYPSPARSAVMLNVPRTSLINTRGSILDVTGKVHAVFMITGIAMNIDISRLSPGMYMIRLADGTSAKFLKE